MKETFSIADASKLTGFTPRQLRSHEERGLISLPIRITCGEIKYRRYTPEQITEIKAFKGFLEEGYTLAMASKKALEKSKKEDK